MDKFEKMVQSYIDGKIYMLDWYFNDGEKPLSQKMITEELDNAKILLGGLRKYQAMKKALKELKTEIEVERKS